MLQKLMDKRIIIIIWMMLLGSVIIFIRLLFVLFEHCMQYYYYYNTIYCLLQVRPGIKRLKRYTVEFVDGRTENFDAIILATGYKSNVPYWLKVY